MIPEIDIWRAAHLMIQQHREIAAHQADARVSALIERDDSERMAKAIPGIVGKRLTYRRTNETANA